MLASVLTKHMMQTKIERDDWETTHALDLHAIRPHLDSACYKQGMAILLHYLRIAALIESQYVSCGHVSICIILAREGENLTLPHT